ncbi:hypothetical protein AAVH_14440 [Aphelenchoides avenae]|nr:hypothetical protein AAVH_14440 [Aphelenchus avenae]
MDLRKFHEPEVCTSHAKLLNYAIEREQLRITALVHDDSKVIVKIFVLEVPSEMRLDLLSSLEPSFTQLAQSSVVVHSVK